MAAPEPGLHPTTGSSEERFPLQQVSTALTRKALVAQTAEKLPGKPRALAAAAAAAAQPAAKRRATCPSVCPSVAIRDVGVGSQRSGQPGLAQPRRNAAPTKGFQSGGGGGQAADGKDDLGEGGGEDDHEGSDEAEALDDHPEVCAECGLSTESHELPMSSSSSSSSLSLGPVLLCDQCDSEVHLRCAKLHQVPKGTWFCSVCSGSKRVNGGSSRNALFGSGDRGGRSGTSVLSARPRSLRPRC
jgi:hypothetical protein